jgi:hypothetical protein
VRAIGRSVRGNFPSVRAKINLCGHYPICAEKRPGLWAFLMISGGQKETI